MTYTRKLMIAGAVLVSWVAVPGAAWAQTSGPSCLNPDPYTGVCGDVVGPEQLRQDPKVLGSEVSSSQSEPESSTSSGTLPVTGGDLVGLAAIGLGAVGAGTFFVRRSRRTT